MPPKKILLIPLDPVHDFGLRIIRKTLDEAGHETVLLPPDLPLEDIAKRASSFPSLDFILVSRTISYGAPEILARFIDMLEAMGLRRKAKVVVGGMGIDVKIAAEIGFDAGFPSSTTPEEALAYIESRLPSNAPPSSPRPARIKTDMTRPFTYAFHHRTIDSLLEEITDEILKWARNKTSPAIERAKIREDMFVQERDGRPADDSARNRLRNRYLSLCAAEVVDSYRGTDHLPERVWPISPKRMSSIEKHLRSLEANHEPRFPFGAGRGPLLFAQVGSGSPLMDLAHNGICEAWGVDGIITICPSSGARIEGLLDGLLDHEGDGTLLTVDNLRLIKKHLGPETLWGIRAHRGLNSPEAMLYAGQLKADLSKLNFVYGSLGAGTDPARLVVDTLESIRLAARFQIPFDVPSNDELGGVPASKSFAGILIMAKLGRKMMARPILKPLFCFSPDIALGGKMDNNYVDLNAAKIKALRAIVDAPLWVGEPAGFMTHTEDRIQSALTTALHVELGRSLGVEAVTVASTDEAYSRGVINVDSRLDSLKAVETVSRFMGRTRIEPTSAADEWAAALITDIESVLAEARERNGFVKCLYEGVFGGEKEGVYPGRTGAKTVRKKKLS